MKVVAACLVAAVPYVCRAGGPDGLQLLILGTDRAMDAHRTIDQYLADYENSIGSFDCDDNMLNIGSTKRGPVAALSTGKALASLSNSRPRIEFSKALAAFRNPQIRNGFDGALLYDVQEGTLKLFEISAWTKEKIHRAEIKAVDWSNKEKFRRAMCHAIVGMPVLRPQ